MIRLFSRVVILSAFLAFVGCSTSSSTREQATWHEAKTAEYYLRLADQAALPSDSIEYQLQAADLYIRGGNLSNAQRTLRSIHLDNLDPAIRRLLLNTRLSLLKKDVTRAQSLLRDTIHEVQAQQEKKVRPKSSFQSRSSRRPTERIALLLPSSGPHALAAKTIRDGFFAAYYQNSASQDPNSSVKIYDTGKGNRIREAYEEALRDDPNFIVGPLTKSEVQSIAKMELSTPVLALNTLTESRHPTFHLYQFGLMPDDEVIATADRAFEQGHRRAAILAFQNDWGQRLAHKFKEYWKMKGGDVVDTLSFKQSNIDSRVKSLLKAKKDSRRDDVDMIFLAATPETARQIKPLLSFYHAEKLPVYATSTVYSGTPDPAVDNDLNGIHFCDMPWVLQHSHHMQEIQHKIEKVWGAKANRAPRFFALGMDAYKLANQLIKSDYFPIEGISGLTGDLRLNPYQHIQRDLVCAKFDKGVPIPEHDQSKR